MAQANTSFSVYAHLTPTTHPGLICETVKLTIKSGSEEQATEETKTESDAGDSINDVVT